jgi:GDP-D-mannose dehydratase
VKLKTVLAQMTEIAGYDIEVEVNPAFVRANELPILVGSVDKLIALIGAIPDYPLKHTLAKMLKA